MTRTARNVNPSYNGLCVDVKRFQLSVTVRHIEVYLSRPFGIG